MSLLSPPTTLAGWREAASRLSFASDILIDGTLRPAVDGQTFATVNPASGDTLAEIAAGSAADVDLAVASARRTFDSGVWSRRPPTERKVVLLRLAELIRAHAPELALLDSLDMGKPVQDALGIDVPGAAAVWQWTAESIDKVYDQIAPTGSGDLAMIRREPLGVVAAVVPWNFPLDLASWKCAPALAAGNSVVLKPAEQSPLSAIRLGQLALEAGLPPGVLNVVPGLGASAGKALGLHPDVDALTFTGSTEVGKLFLSYAGQSNMKQVWLECGGKSPNLIFADCDDLDKAAEMAAFGCFFNQGEVCSANSRLLVEARIKEEFLERLIHHAAHWLPGDPLDPANHAGALVETRHADRVEGFIRRGEQQARLIHGGQRLTIAGSDCYITPTIFDQVTPSHELFREEIFGPVLAVSTFETEGQAIALANDSLFGLAGSLWTGSLKRALRVSERLRVGTVSVNTVDALSPQTPFGGIKQSGHGRDLSLHALEKFTALKTVWIKY
ncbi:aldehyde dehydrogenase [Insolitispirillum peregrinum]|uniref:aldehyde dehydrogenase n=1 Tax=Insolitispirillum peregrinum TaxID=80876 RepID=UPI0036169D16